MHSDTIDDADFEEFLRRVNITVTENKEGYESAASNLLELCFNSQNVSTIVDPVEEHPVENNQANTIRETTISDDCIETIEYIKAHNFGSTREMIIRKDEDILDLEVSLRIFQGLCSDHKELLSNLKVTSGSCIDHVKTCSFIEVTLECLKQSVIDQMGPVEFNYREFSAGL